jgi:aconitate hydratase
MNRRAASCAHNIASRIGNHWLAGPNATYDEEIEIDLSKFEPLIAQLHSPDNVVPVKEFVGIPVRQVSVGSSVNSSYRDLMVTAQIMKGNKVAPSLHMTLSPGSRQILTMSNTIAVCSRWR